MLKNILVKLKESEVAKQSSGKQVDSLVRKLNSKVTENDRLQADLSSERKIRIAVEENLSSCNVELESLKLQFKNEIEKNVILNHDLEREKNKTSELQKSIESHTTQIIRWQEQLETGNEEIRKQKDVIALRDSELIEAKHLLKLARSEINSTEVANSKLLNRVGLIQNENSENFANQFAKISEVENELFLSKNLIKKIKKENEMYKDFLSKTSSNEAKNTEKMVKICNHNQELNDEKLHLLDRVKQLESKSNALSSETGNLRVVNKKMEQELIANRNKNIEFEKLKNQLADETERSKTAEARCSQLERRLIEQAKAESDAAALQATVRRELETKISALKNIEKEEEIIPKTNIVAEDIMADFSAIQKNKSEINNLKNQIEVLKGQFNSDTIEHTELQDSFNEINTQFESFISSSSIHDSELDMTNGSVLVEDFRLRLHDIENRLDSLPETASSN